MDFLFLPSHLLLSVSWHLSLSFRRFLFFAHCLIIALDLSVSPAPNDATSSSSWWWPRTIPLQTVTRNSAVVRFFSKRRSVYCALYPRSLLVRRSFEKDSQFSIYWTMNRLYRRKSLMQTNWKGLYCNHVFYSFRSERQTDGWTSVNRLHCDSWSLGVASIRPPPDKHVFTDSWKDFSPDHVTCAGVILVLSFSPTEGEETWCR